MKSKKKNRKALAFAAAAVLLWGGAAGALLYNYVWTGESFVPKTAGLVRLAEMTPEEYERLQAKLPGCRIIWQIPLAGSSYPSDSTRLEIGQMNEADWEVLEYFTDLTELDGRQCPDYQRLAAFAEDHPQCNVLGQIPIAGNGYPFDTARLTISEMDAADWEALEYFTELTELDGRQCPDYQRLAAFAEDHPNCDVLWQVPMGDVRYDRDAESLTVADADCAELREKLPYLQKAQTVRLTGVLPEKEAVEQLQKDFPEMDITWECVLGDAAIDRDETRVTFPAVDMDAVQQALGRLPHVEFADLRQTGWTAEECARLAHAYPDIMFLWELTIGELTVSSDAEQLDLSGQTVTDLAALEYQLESFRDLTWVDMSHCGVDDASMDALNRRHADIRFVWSVKIKDVYVRTDANWFYPYKYDKYMEVNNSDLYPLRYCTDMEAIDVGHMVDVTDCEWAAFMPNLKYLIIIETAITDLTPLSNLKNLVFLEIFTTKITDYTPLLGCTALEDLNLGLTYGDYTPITQMTWLKNIWWFASETRGKASYGAEAALKAALPHATMKFWLTNPNVNNGWRQLDNYYKMRDLMGMWYLT